MKQRSFIQDLFEAHQHAKNIPSPALVCKVIDGVLKLMFPELADRILNTLKDEMDQDPQDIECAIMDALPNLRELLLRDARAISLGDPAATGTTEVIRTYPGFLAIAIYRLAHEFYKLEVPLIPRILTEHAHSETGIDIHPGARIGTDFCIDHGTGIVIGETVVIGNQVKIYQGVTLGALSVKKELAQTKRHPTIEDRVVIYSGATILGGLTTIGHDSVIGGNVWLTKSVPPHSLLYYQAAIRQEIQESPVNPIQKNGS